MPGGLEEFLDSPEEEEEQQGLLSVVDPPSEEEGIPAPLLQGSVGALKAKQEKVENIRKIFDPKKAEQKSSGGLLSLASDAAEQDLEEKDPGLLLLDALNRNDVEPHELEAAQSLLRQGSGQLIGGLEEFVSSSDKEFDTVQVPKPDPEFGISDITNFIFGDEMAIIGFKHDQDGFGWDWEVARRQWAEEPMWINLLATASLVGTVAFPAVRAVTTSVKFGRVGSLLGKFGDRALEVDKFKNLGFVEKTASHADLDEWTMRRLRQLEHSRTKHIDFEAKKLAEQEGTLQAGLQLPSGKTMTEFDKQMWRFDKNFTNSYFSQIEEISKNGSVKKEFIDNLDRLWKNENMGRLFVGVPDAARGTAIYSNLLLKAGHSLDLDGVIRRANPGIASSEATKLKNSLKLSPEEQNWADALFDSMKSHQDEAIREGFITAETRDRIGKIHLPAFLKETPQDLASSRTVAAPLTLASAKAGAPPEKILKLFEMPRLDAPQIRARKGEIGDVAERLFKGELLTSPEKLTFSGYVVDRLLLNNFKFIRDHAMKFGRSEDDVIKAFGSIADAEKKGWVSLSKLRNGVPEVESTLARMLKTSGHNIKDGEMLPFIHKSHFESMFGNGGLFEQTQNVGSVLNLLTALHKTAKTVFNIPTHLNNIVGNIILLAMAGFNSFSIKNVKIQDKVVRSFKKWADAHDGIVRAGKRTQDLYDPTTRRIKGTNLGKIKIGNKTFDLNDEFLDPMVKDIVGEESAFLNAEGLAVVQRFLDHAKKGTFTHAVASSMIKAKDASKLGSKVFDTMTKAYLGEDVVPKMSYFLHLRAKGLSREAAALEVGRRLPVYSTVGSAVQSSRKAFLPWVTFPAEALRITKNNMMDNPISTIPWLYLPSLLKVGIAATGSGPTTIDDFEERKRQLPVWAQTPSTAITNKQGSEIGGRAAAAAVGGMAGGAIGGLPGAAIGAAAGGALPLESSSLLATGALAGGIAGGRTGAVVGGALGGIAGLIRSLTKEQNDYSEEYRANVLRWLPHMAFLPTSDSPDLVTDVGGVLSQSPVQPFAILLPVAEIMAGRTGFGTEIPNEGGLDMAGKMVAGFIGTLMPPYIQKYGFKVTTPDQSVTKQAFGTDLPGDITNVSRFLIDSGQAVDPITGEPGNFTFDFLLNNLNGLWQTHAVRPEVRLANEERQQAALGEIRSFYSKQLSFYAKNNDWKAAEGVIEKVFSTFSRQYSASPAMAQDKFADWMKRNIKFFGRHPALRSLSEEEILARFSTASDFSRGARTQARKDLLTVLEREQSLRKNQ